MADLSQLKFHKINPKEISFVFQGPVIEEYTSRALQSVRNNFPDSTIILSTWKGTVVNNLAFDILKMNKDPGPGSSYRFDKNSPNNINRQIISTKNGLDEVQTKYVVKLRTDIFFNNSNLLYLLAKIKKNKSDNFFESKIIILADVSMNPKKRNTLYLALSDWIYCGLTNDIKDLFNIKLMPQNEMNWFEINKPSNLKSIDHLLSRFCSEQYILLAYLKERNYETIPIDAFDKENLSRIHSGFLPNNFILKNYKNLGVNSFKHPLSFYFDHSRSFTEKEFLNINKLTFFDPHRLFYDFISLLKSLIPRRIYLLIKNAIK